MIAQKDIINVIYRIIVIPKLERIYVLVLNIQPLSVKNTYDDEYKMFGDGFCRHQDYRIPNQRVCPLGKVLCPDLSCRDTMMIVI